MPDPASREPKLETLIGTLLSERRQTLALAESCTGGRISSRLTAVPGSSRYFEAGCVTYSNASKTRLLDVPERLITAKGAVSPEVALAMAEGVRACAKTDFALAVTGIAGPGGGSVEKPVGLVYIALAYADQRDVVEFRFEGGRETIQSAATGKALRMLFAHLNALE